MAKKPTDGELIQLSLEDPDLFAEIFDAHYAAIYRFASAALGRLRAEDIAGEVFVRAFESRHRFDPSYESARPWLYGIASNLIQDHLRKTARQHRAYQRAATGEEAQSGFENEVASRVDAARSIPGLMDALMALREEEASVVILFVAGDRTYQEIASILEIPIGTVRSRLSRARQTLRNWRTDIDEEDPGDHDE